MVHDGAEQAAVQKGEIFEALSMIVSIGENYSMDHGRQVAWLSWRLLQELGLAGGQDEQKLEYCWYGALLHDIGEIYLSDRLLGKKGPLSAKEWQEMKQHPVYGARLLENIPQLAPAIPMIRGHHERWDGSGYPYGLMGEEIPLAVQVLGLADCLAAFTAPRTYRNSLSPREMVRELENMKGTKFSAQLVQPVLRLLKKDGDWLKLDPRQYAGLSREMAGRVFAPGNGRGNFAEEVVSIQLLSKVIDTKHLYTREHSQRVGAYAVKLAETMGLSGAEVHKCRIAGLLHDAGKVAIPSHILDKPGKLTKIEYQVINNHPEMSFRILNNMSKYRDIAVYSRHHHERYDGYGYPHGLKGEQIPLISRIIGVVDAYDAMTSTRSYREALDRETAIKEIQQNAGTQFDPEIVYYFSRLDLEKIREGEER